MSKKLISIIVLIFLMLLNLIVFIYTPAYIKIIEECFNKIIHVNIQKRVLISSIFAFISVLSYVSLMFYIKIKRFKKE